MSGPILFIFLFIILIVLFVVAGATSTVVTVDVTDASRSTHTQHGTPTRRKGHHRRPSSSRVLFVTGTQP